MYLQCHYFNTYIDNVHLPKCFIPLWCSKTIPLVFVAKKTLQNHCNHKKQWTTFQHYVINKANAMQWHGQKRKGGQQFADRWWASFCKVQDRAKGPVGSPCVDEHESRWMHLCTFLFMSEELELRCKVVYTKWGGKHILKRMVEQDKIDERDEKQRIGTPPKPNGMATWRCNAKTSENDIPLSIHGTNRIWGNLPSSSKSTFRSLVR